MAGSDSSSLSVYSFIIFMLIYFFIFYVNLFIKNKFFVVTLQYFKTYLEGYLQVLTKAIDFFSAEVAFRQKLYARFLKRF